ncbi:MAG TPA: hypothetical protein V6D29_24800 [Leptolyngbyaceae cyanobacterium]
MNRIKLALLPLLVLPVLIAAPVQAQSNQPVLFTQSSPTLRTVGNEGKTLYLNTDAVREYTLRVETATTFSGINLPAGALVRGQFEPVSGGLRYVAHSVEANGRTYSVRAASDTLHDVKDPRETTAGAILTDAAIGAAGGAAIGGILGGGRINVGEVIGGAAAGAVLGNVTAQRVVVVEPNKAIVLTAQ